MFGFPKRWWARVLVVLGTGFVLIQLVPYGRSHTNPPVRQEPAWNSPRTRALSQRACYDCHSNETVWPWYSHVAPVSWLVQHDVDEGREHLNLSEFDAPQKNAEEAAEEVEKGAMPPTNYLRAHPEARFSESEKQEMLSGLRATFGESGGGDRRRRGGADDGDDD